MRARGRGGAWAVADRVAPGEPDDVGRVQLAIGMAQQHGEVREAARIAQADGAACPGHGPDVAVKAEDRRVVGSRWRRCRWRFSCGLAAAARCRGSQRQLLIEDPQGQVGSPLEREAPPGDAVLVEPADSVEASAVKPMPKTSWLAPAGQLNGMHPYHVLPAGSRR